MKEKQEKIIKFYEEEDEESEFEKPIIKVVKNRFLTAWGIMEEIIIKKQRIIRDS